MSQPTPTAAVFTACSANYLNKALAMCASVQTHNPDLPVVVLLVDAKRPVEVLMPGVEVLWAEDLGFPDFLSCAFKYNIIELNTALKPFAARSLLRRFRKVVYLDPDVCVFAGLDTLLDHLDDASALFTPHALSPYTGNGRPTDQDLLRFGSYNLGFFAVNDSARADDLLQWWHRQCATLCFYEPQLGLGVDQKWIDLAPSFFEGVRILRDPGLNVAFWNLHERRIDGETGRWLVNGRDRLTFVHFSSFIEGDRNAVADKQTRYEAGSRPDFACVADVYRTYLGQAAGQARLDATYAYATFDNGQAITPLLRRVYATLLADRFAGCANPFAAGGPVHAFARRNGLLSRGAARIQHQNFKVAEGFRRERRILALVFRTMLRVLGPDRYFALMRYLGHYSSTLNQADMFR